MFYPYGKQYIDNADIEKVSKVLKSDLITQGPKVDEFEKRLAAKVNAKYCVVFNSGTAALHAAYFAAGLKQEDQFITTPNSFAATSNAGLYLNAEPVFVDVEYSTGNIDVNNIESKITSNTKLISPVHYSGQPVDLLEIAEIAEKNNLVIIEDACHAIGASYHDSIIGDCRYSDMTVFSFHPVKHVAAGEGGAVTTNNLDYYKKLKMFVTHGITKEDMEYPEEGPWYYEIQFLGYNYRLTDIHCQLGISQLERLDANVLRRREIAGVYDKEFESNKYFLPLEQKTDRKSSYHIYPILLKDDFVAKKKEFFLKLREYNLGVQVHYIPIYRHPLYRNLGYKHEDYPNCDDFYHREITIPLYPTLIDPDLDEIIKRIHKASKEVFGD
jgi:UDP-4-amino-4,6-dideoxy-N-acetyl-beta-L-altrosamine transaminase